MLCGMKLRTNEQIRKAHTAQVMQEVLVALCSNPTVNVNHYVNLVEYAKVIAVQFIKERYNT